MHKKFSHKPHQIMIASWFRYWKSFLTSKTIQKYRNHPPIIFSFLFGVTRETAESNPTPCKDYDSDIITKSKMYWSTKPISEIINEADHLFNKGHFLQVYEFLNRLKYHNNAEIQWRISRALFKLSREESLSHELRNEMINEAYAIMTSTMKLEENNPNVYKWMAIILDAKCGIEGLDKRVHSFPTVKSYLLKAVELNPQDAVSLYILGKWCFEMASMSLLQRFICRLLYGQIPDSTFGEAYDYLLKSSEIFPDSYYIPNMYMLGETCYRLNQFFRARYYLSGAASLPVRTIYEKECADKAKLLLKRLDIYDLSQASFNSTEPF